MTDGGFEESGRDRSEPFWSIMPHRSIRRDIRQMKDNLDDLESIVEEAEWLALGGKGYVEFDRADKLCEAVEGSMSFIQDDIHELPEPYGPDSGRTGGSR